MIVTGIEWAARGREQVSDKLAHGAAAVCHILPLTILRMVFGVLMLLSTIRFAANGWIHEFYVKPGFHFSYGGFEWLRPLPAAGMTAVFVLIGLTSLFIALGLFYRASISTFFFLFTYVELLDKTYYLNHYYFISLFSFLLIWLPLHKNYSIDVVLRPFLKTEWVPVWTLWVVRLQIGLVYFFAGLAKLNSDWLLDALPLRIWLPARATFPVIGPLLDQVWLAYAMSWSGALFDLTIPFFLIWRRTRPYAYLAVIVFHSFTGLLFNIGMFPWIMIGCTLVFFSADELRSVVRMARYLAKRLRLLNFTHRGTGAKFFLFSSHAARVQNRTLLPSTFTLLLLTLFFLFQLLFPLRHWLYPGNVLWTEEGFRQSWRVMLVEKTGHVTFYVMEKDNGRTRTIYPSQYLTLAQEKQMSFQPDMILQFAHFLADSFGPNVEVRAEAYVSLNGRRSRLLLDPTIDLSSEENSWRAKPWILP